MLKLAFAALAATALLGAATAQAQVRTRGHDAWNGRYEALTPYDANAAVVGDNRSGMNVMGLRVPNGFRHPAAASQGAY